MSYCRWSCPVPELTPDVDVSWEKMLELYKVGGYDSWKQYLDDNGVVLSDAYVYESCEGGFVCHWKGGDEPDWTDTAHEMAQILTQSVEKGKHIPRIAIEALLEEAES